MAEKIYIPAFISDVNNNPARVLPRLFFYNGLLDCEPYFIQHYTDPSGSVQVSEFTQFPYFDHYSSGLSSGLPSTTSRSLLFQNENSTYGQVPNESLYTQYWETYITLLYNPKTRLLNASAIIPLANYFNMELNDIVEFRGNYYHLRAINDYSFTTGECLIQLLGPILDDSLQNIFPPTYPLTQIFLYDNDEEGISGVESVKLACPAIVSGEFHAVYLEERTPGLSGTAQVGDYIYVDSGRTTPIPDNYYGYADSTGNYAIQMSNGQVVTMIRCV